MGAIKEAPSLRVLGTEATHVSRRIFLSATTSPVTLFLALYTTPYVPSPIFSTFWKFSMKPASESGQSGPGAEAWDPCRKRATVLAGGGGETGPRDSAPGTDGTQRISPSCQFPQLETMLPPPLQFPTATRGPTPPSRVSLAPPPHLPIGQRKSGWDEPSSPRFKWPSPT